MMRIVVVIVFCLLFVPFGVYAVQPGMLNQMLDAQIERLEQELTAKQKQLSDCQSATKKLKTAGSVTLATTAAGATANIALAAKLKNMTAGGSGTGMPTDNRSQEQRNCDACTMFINAGISPLPDECTGCA